MKAPIKLLLADYNNVARQDLERQLIDLGYWVTSAHDEGECLQQLRWRPDLIITDVDLPVRHGAHSKPRLGLAIAKRFRDIDPVVAIVFYSTNEDYLDAVEELYREGNGGIGYIAKNASLNLMSILPAVLAGNWVSVFTRPPSTQKLTEETFLAGLSAQRRQSVLFAAEQLASLTDQERRTVSILGENNRAIADALKIAVNTVETRLTNIYCKLGVNTVDRRLRTVLLDRALCIHTLRQNQKHVSQK